MTAHAAGEPVTAGATDLPGQGWADAGQQTAPPPPAAAEDRGRLTVEDRVVEKTAGYAVTLAPHAAAAPRRVLGVSLGGARPDHTADVSARVEGEVATVRATIAVQWPHSVREVTDAVRRRIRDEVQTVADVTVHQIDLDVVSMTLPQPARGRVQ